jgi:glycosyltransferase involved in cell wall biosynthesis
VKIVLATETPRLPAERALAEPCGGVEIATALLVRALARAGHEVTVLAGTAPTERDADGALWAPEAHGRADLVIANRAPKLFRTLPQGRRVLWLHNPARYLRKPRHMWPLLLAWPRIVVLGGYHRSTLPRVVAGRAVEIPLAVAPPFDAGGQEQAAPPPPVAVFASNPLRGLDSLLALWAGRILPAVPEARLHVFSGPGVYAGDAKLAARAAPVLERAAHTPGVVLRGPQPREVLARKYARARAMLYLGDAGETFCLAVAEAQAMGLPCVLGTEGSVPERIADGLSGVLAADQDAFAEAAIRLLRDDAHWRALHRGALARGPGADWNEVAARFVELAR